MKQSFYIETLGCSKNTVDSEKLALILKRNGLTPVYSINDADFIFINTCGFILPAKEESINTILEIAADKTDGQKLIVLGCLVERYKEDLKKEIPEVDDFIKVSDYDSLIAILKRNGIGIGELEESKFNSRLYMNDFSPPHISYVKIAEGCNNKCSFCSIPIIKGKQASLSIEEIIEEIKTLKANRNIKEFNIIAQDTTDYGIDIYGSRKLRTLLEQISNTVDKDNWIRLLYLYPKTIDEDFVKFIHDTPNICNYVDIPIQHIDDNILKSMRRGHRESDIRKLFEMFKKYEITIRSGVITGYPGEDDKAFKKLSDFIQEGYVDKLGVFAYSAEEDTFAFSLKETITEEEKEMRKIVLYDIQKEIIDKKNSEAVGKTKKVLIDFKEGDYLVGRSEEDAYEIDQNVLVKNIDKGQIGEFNTVKIVENSLYDLIGEIEK